MTTSESTVRISGTDPTEASKTRVLAALNSPGNQRLLIDWLAERSGYTGLEAADGDLSTVDFDIVVVDRQTLQAMATGIREAKEASGTFLPVLLVTADIDKNPGGMPGKDERGDVDHDLVDEVLHTPIDEAVLERRLMTLAQTRAQAVALEAQKEQLMLLNRITRHDIRNEMNVVMGWTEALESHTDEEGDEMRERILSSSQHVVDLTRAVRDFVDALGSADEVELEPIPLREVLTEEFEKRQSTFEAAEFSLGSDIPSVRVLANDLLASVFRNLLNNAVQHNDTKTPRVTISVERQEERVQVSVIDNGPGIEPALRPAVLGRTDEGLDHPAAGIGLYLVETLVNQYGGRVTLADASSGGLKATIDLKIATDVTHAQDDG